MRRHLRLRRFIVFCLSLLFVFGISAIIALGECILLDFPIYSIGKLALGNSLAYLILDHAFE